MKEKVIYINLFIIMTVIVLGSHYQETQSHIETVYLVAYFLTTLILFITVPLLFYFYFRIKNIFFSKSKEEPISKLEFSSIVDFMAKIREEKFADILLTSIFLKDKVKIEIIKRWVHSHGQDYLKQTTPFFTSPYIINEEKAAGLIILQKFASNDLQKKLDDFFKKEKYWTQSFLVLANDMEDMMKKEEAIHIYKHILNYNNDNLHALVGLLNIYIEDNPKEDSLEIINKLTALNLSEKFNKNGAIKQLVNFYKKAGYINRAKLSIDTYIDNNNYIGDADKYKKRMNL